jgi:hypothetical protein
MFGHMGRTQNIRNLPNLAPSSVVLCAMQPTLRFLLPLTFLGGENLMKNLGLPRRTYYSAWSYFLVVGEYFPLPYP